MINQSAGAVDAAGRARREAEDHARARESVEQRLAREAEERASHFTFGFFFSARRLATFTSSTSHPLPCALLLEFLFLADGRTLCWEERLGCHRSG
jgi:hypothetical protein